MKRLLKQLRENQKTVVLAMIFAVLGQVGSLVLPMMMSDIINNGIANKDLEYIKKVGIMMMAVSAFSVFISVISSYYSSKASADYGRNLRRKLFVKVESFSPGDIDKISTPSLITRCTNDVRVMQDFILTCIRMMISAPVMLVGGTVMAFIMNPKLSTIIFAIIPIIAVIVLFVLKKVIPIFRVRQKKLDGINRFIRQKLSGIRVIKAFNKEEYEDKNFQEQNVAFSALTLKFQRIMAVLIPICIVLVILALDCLILFAAKNLDAMDVVTQHSELVNAVGNLQAFVIYMIMIVFSVTMAAAMFVIVPRAKISAKRIVEVLDIEPSITDPEREEKIKEENRGTIEFRDVTFSYENAESPVLSHISFTAEKNKVTAIIGGTGSGKTTLVNLITRFYDTTEGSVLFGGVDVRNLSQSQLHSRIGYVPQKVCLFSGTVEDNLRFGDLSAGNSKLRRALNISCSSEFVDRMPEGRLSFVSQNANNLSGGQKQRLSIARAVIKDADVYIFDDSFSALDFKTDAEVRKNIRENLNATVIIVAQRVGTIMDADRILVLDEGRIVGNGNHSRLMESCEQYRQIYTSQMGGGQQ